MKTIPGHCPIPKGTQKSPSMSLFYPLWDQFQPHSFSGGVATLEKSQNHKKERKEAGGVRHQRGEMVISRIVNSASRLYVISIHLHTLQNLG